MTSEELMREAKEATCLKKEDREALIEKIEKAIKEIDASE